MIWIRDIGGSIWNAASEFKRIGINWMEEGTFKEGYYVAAWFKDGSNVDVLPAGSVPQHMIMISGPYFTTEKAKEELTLVWRTLTKK